MRLRKLARLPLQLGALLLALLVAPALAQGPYPAARDPLVNDFAGIITPESDARIRALAGELKRGQGADLVVTTIGSIGDYDTGADSIETFATGLFNTWGIGDSATNRGVLVLLAVNDRQVRIELGRGYGARANEAMQSVIDRHMLPAFRDGDYNAGILAGIAAIGGELDALDRRPAPPAAPQNLAPPVQQPDARPDATGPRRAAPFGPSPGALLLGAAGLLGGGALAVNRYQEHLRTRPRACPNCQAQMARLDEAGDDLYLASGQRVEEMLASIDYDVWLCPQCNTHDLQRYPRMFSGWKDCPGCHHRTMRVHRRVIDRPSYSSTGRDEITRACQHCDYHDVDYVITPRLQRSTSSSYRSSSGGSSGGGSRGGGSSGGGGASGSW